MACIGSQCCSYAVYLRIIAILLCLSVIYLACCETFFRNMQHNNYISFSQYAYACRCMLVKKKLIYHVTLNKICILAYFAMIH